MVNEDLSAIQFCGLQLEDDVPDHSTISRFRKERTEKKGMDRILRKIKTQLEKQKLIVKTGIAVDKNGMIVGTHTTTANEHDSKGLAPLLKK